VVAGALGDVPGAVALDAVLRRDYLVVQMGLLVLTVAVMLSNFIADVLYTYLDPRIRYDSQGTFQ